MVKRDPAYVWSSQLTAAPSQGLSGEVAETRLVQESRPLLFP